MIAALYSSRPTGSKKLTLEGRQFGWETIEKIYDQEMKRAETGRSRKVPGLKYAFVYRDNWTRLNVKPAKIMQVIELLYNCKSVRYISFVIYVGSLKKNIMPFSTKNLGLYKRHVTL